MTRPTRIAAIAITTALAAVSLTAYAHTGHHAGHDSHTFLDGLAHPFFGADHLFAMLLVGAWSVLHARLVWLAPLTFVTLLALGTLAGQNGLAVPQLEPLVAASVVVFGLMLAIPFRLGQAWALAIIGGFALFHGVAHGSELSSTGSVLAGIVAGSAILHASGMALAHFVLKQRPKLALYLGRLSALIGGGLVLSSAL